MAKDGLIPIAFPLIEVDALSMVLPTTMGPMNSGRYPDLLAKARDKKVPYVFTIMNRPGKSKFPTRFYNTGVVASVEGASNSSSVILLKGNYRARLRKVEETSSKLSYYVASIGEIIEDKPEKFFTISAEQLIVNPAHDIEFRGLMFNIRRKIVALLEECRNFIDSEIELLEAISDNFDNLNLNHRDILDEFVWHVVFAVPYINLTGTPKFRHICECLILCKAT